MRVALSKSRVYLIQNIQIGKEHISSQSSHHCLPTQRVLSEDNSEVAGSGWTRDV